MTPTTSTTTSNFSSTSPSPGSGEGEEGGEIALDNLYPAIVQCFAIIVCGYIAGRCQLISQSEGKGLATFVSYFCLPSLIFLSMARLDFTVVNWTFLLSITISKAAVFVVVVLVTLLVYRPKDSAKAGLYAIFCTQSNDFALGYPIVLALYGKSHPDFPAYLYLVAPISLVLLNPVGFVLMELGKRKQQQQQQQSVVGEGVPGGVGGVLVGLQITRDVLLNPVVLMTTLGIVGNLVFTHELPRVLEGLLEVLGKAFSGTALFLLGLRMVGKVGSLRGTGLVVPGILIATKTLVLPLVTREVVSLLQPGTTANETGDFASYGFLYGTFPTAPGVFVFATQYNVAVDLIASAMVACTFLSAPLMFVSAKMATLIHVNALDYLRELETILLHVSVLGLLATSWVVVVFLLNKKWRKVPHFITLCLALAQLTACVGALLWAVLDCNHSWKLYLQFVLFSGGVFAARLWTAVLAVAVLMLRWRSVEFVLRARPVFAAVGWGVPGILVTLLLLTVQQQQEAAAAVTADKQDPNFQYGGPQAIVSLLLLWLCLFTTIACLILHQRHLKRYHQYTSLRDADLPPSPSHSPTHSPRSSTTTPPLLDYNGSIASSTTTLNDDSTTTTTTTTAATATTTTTATATTTTIKDVFEGPCSSLRHEVGITSQAGTAGTGGLFSWNVDSDNSETELLEGGREEEGGEVGGGAAAGVEAGAPRSPLTEPLEVGIVRDRDDHLQLTRHIVLLLCLCVSMIVGFALCLWSLFLQQINGVYIELVFLDTLLNFGQGIITAAIFGLDYQLVVVPALRWWRRVSGGPGVVRVPTWSRLDSGTRQICDQFVTFHMDKCVRDIVSERRWRPDSLSGVFLGKELVDWLLLVGLAGDRAEAVKYGESLLLGGVISHLRHQHHFHDQPLYYTFRTHHHHHQQTIHPPTL